MIYKAPIELNVIIESVVDSMRETAGIGLIVADGVNWKYPATNTLSKNDYISLNDGVTTWTNQRVISATSTYFILADYYLATEFKSNAPYFMCEKEQKAANILTEKTKQDTYKWQKYPLLLLTRPYTDDRTSQMLGYTVDFNIHILYNSDPNYWESDRIDNNFTPILYPLYVDFLNKLVLNRWVKEKDPNEILHNKTDLLLISNAANDANPFPDVLDGITIAFDNLEVLKNVTPCEVEAAEQYNLVLSSGVGGSATSSVGDEGTILVNSGTNVAAYAIVDAGYRFVKWIRNNINITLNPYPFIFTQYTDLKAYFIAQWQLTTSAVGAGTVTPASGIYDDGAIVELNAEPIDPLVTELDRIEENGVPVSIVSPYFATMNMSKIIIGYFQNIYTTIQDIFTTTPILSGTDWIFEDQTINGNNAIVKNTQYITLNGTNNFFRSIKKYTYLTTGFRVNIKFSIPSTPGFWSICGTRGGADYQGQWFLKLTATTIYLYYFDGSINKSITIADAHVNNRIRNIEVTFIGGIFTMNLTDEISTNKTVSSGVETITPSKSETVTFGNEYIDVNTIFIPISIYETVVENTITETIPYLDYKCEDSDGPVIYDNSGRGNDAVCVGTITNIWDNFKDSIQPHMLQNIYTLYQNNTTSAYLRRINNNIDSNLYISIASGQSNMLNFVYINQMNLVVASYLPAGIGEDDIYEYKGTIFIDNSQNGANIDYWSKDLLGDGWVRYKNCVDRVIAYANIIGKTPVFMSEIWMQGESDTDTALEYNAYEANWRALISNKRGISTHLVNLPIQDFLLSVNATGLDSTGKGVVNAAKIAVAGDTTGVDVVNTDTYTFKPDNIHYNDSQAPLQKAVWDATYTKPTYIYNDPGSNYTRLEEISSGFSNTGNALLGIKKPGWELLEKTFTEISAEPAAAIFVKPGETANNIPQLIIKE